MFKIKSKGFSLVEIAIASLILAVSIGPIITLFTSSKKLDVSTKEINLSIQYSNDLIGAIHQKINLISDTVDINNALDSSLTGNLNLSSLGINPTPSNIHRFLTIKVIETLSDSKFFFVGVKISWVSKANNRSHEIEFSNTIQKF